MDEVKNIEYWYDRHTKDWCIDLFDGKGNVMNTIWCGNRTSLEFELGVLERSFPSATIQHWKG